MNETPGNAPGKSRRSWIWLVLVAPLLAGVFAANWAGRRVTPAKLPTPNGYDDLVRAGSMIRGEWPNKGNLVGADLTEFRAFLAANRAALDRMRVGLGRESLVPIEDSPEGLNRHFESIGSLRSLGRLLRGESIVALADGRVEDALRADLDGLRLGLAVAKGGMGNDLAVGCAIQVPTLGGIAGLRDRIPSVRLAGLIRDLEEADRLRVTPEAVEARWLAWYQGAHNPAMRAMLRWSGALQTGKTAERTMILRARERVDRRLRFLLAELAIHAHHEDKRAWPRSVRELVPAYLSAVPIDPATGRAIDYPANEAGELTDDLSAIARPDGEVRPRP